MPMTRVVLVGWLPPGFGTSGAASPNATIHMGFWDRLTDLKPSDDEFFCHIGRKRKELLARLRGIDKVLRMAHSDFLVQLDLELRAELDETLPQEESLWLQKSRVQCVEYPRISRIS
ncbi:hypothetical protein V6N11_018244 [Hibiscus sabdariffa]|uniref:Uncharacterized protein n=1 Tax=Hibiscus sabdariffa TaxID=183260 RepID=A0ABR2T6V3_9ROSI